MRTLTDKAEICAAFMRSGKAKCRRNLCRAGVRFLLTGPSGCTVVLFIHDDTQPEQIDRAKAEAMQKAGCDRLYDPPRSEGMGYGRKAPTPGRSKRLDRRRPLDRREQAVSPDYPRDGRTGAGGQIRRHAPGLLQRFDDGPGLHQLDDANKAKLDAMDASASHIGSFFRCSSNM